MKSKIVIIAALSCASLLGGCAAAIAPIVAVTQRVTTHASADASTATCVLSQRTTAADFVSNVRATAKSLDFDVINAMPTPTGATLVTLSKHNTGFSSLWSITFVSLGVTLQGDGKTVAINSSTRSSSGSSEDVDKVIKDFQGKLKGGCT